MPKKYHRYRKPIKNQTKKHTLSPSQAAREIGMCFYFLMDHIRAGNLPTQKLGRNIRIDPTDLEKFADDPPELPQMDRNQSTQLNIRNIPFDLRSRFRKWCMDKEISMQDAVKTLIEKAMAED